MIPSWKIAIGLLTLQLLCGVKGSLSAATLLQREGQQYLLYEPEILWLENICIKLSKDDVLLWRVFTPKAWELLRGFVAACLSSNSLSYSPLWLKFDCMERRVKDLMWRVFDARRFEELEGIFFEFKAVLDNFQAGLAALQRNLTADIPRTGIFFNDTVLQRLSAGLGSQPPTGYAHNLLAAIEVLARQNRQWIQFYNDMVHHAEEQLSPLHELSLATATTIATATSVVLIPFCDSTGGVDLFDP